MHMLRPTPVLKNPRKNDASRGSAVPPGDDSGKNLGGDVDTDPDSDHFG